MLPTLTIHKDSDKTIVLCWIPAHVGIGGNEIADKEAKKALNLTAQSKIPYTDIKPIVSEYCNSLFQETWSQICEQTENKLYDIQKDLKQMPSPIFKCRSDETRYYRCLIGHAKMTKKYIYMTEKQRLSANVEACLLSVSSIYLQNARSINNTGNCI